MRARLGICALGALALSIAPFLSPAVLAQPKKDDSAWTFVKYDRYYATYEVKADGTHVERHEWAMRVLAEAGVEAANSASINYTEQLQDVEILEAYTLKPDGRRIDAPPDNYQVQRGTGRGDADPMFSDNTAITVAFPGVAVGDVTVFSYRLVQKEALFAGHFSLAVPFSRDYLYDDIQIRVSAPESLKLRVLARDIDGGQIERADGWRQWLFTFRNEKRAKEDYSGVSWLDAGPLILASTFKDFEALGAAYELRARPKAAVTERVRTLADELTRDAVSPRAQVKALYDWVSKNIRYAEIAVGAGSVVPRDVDRILTNRMGDCKDHAVLLQALMYAKGIPSTFALVQSGAAYTLPALPVIQGFNHVINYVPSLDLFVDATAQNIPFGSLSRSTSNKPVVITDAPHGVRKTPAVDYRTNWVRVKTTLRFHRDSSADGETKVEAGGWLASGIKYWFEHMQPQDEEDVVRRVLAKNGFAGTGTLIRADASQVAETYSYGSRYRIEDAINLPGPGALYVLSPFPGPGSVSSYTAILNRRPATRDFVCAGASFREEFVYSLPANGKTLAVSRGARFQGKHTSYKSTYTRHGNMLSVVRELEDRVPNGLCAMELDAEYRAMAKVIFKDLRSQLVYR